MLLYRIVQAHFETCLSLSGEGWDDNPVPAYVDREFRRYLECGILAHGFARARCPECPLFCAKTLYTRDYCARGDENKK